VEDFRPSAGHARFGVTAGLSESPSLRPTPGATRQRWEIDGLGIRRAWHQPSTTRACQRLAGIGIRGRSGPVAPGALRPDPPGEMKPRKYTRGGIEQGEAGNCGRWPPPHRLDAGGRSPRRPGASGCSVSGFRFHLLAPPLGHCAPITLLRLSTTGEGALALVTQACSWAAADGGIETGGGGQRQGAAVPPHPGGCWAVTTASRFPRAVRS